jgi:hypothetical protein
MVFKISGGSKLKGYEIETLEKPLSVSFLANFMNTFSIPREVHVIIWVLSQFISSKC